MSESTLQIPLLGTDGATRTHHLQAPPAKQPSGAPPSARIAYAAAHVVPKPWADNTPGRPADIDWDATLAFRRHVWSCGLGVADAMDTAQRNMGLDWPATVELIRRSAAEARHVGGRLVVGVNTDHLPDTTASLRQIADAYLEQLELAEAAGADVVLMASRHLARAATTGKDYASVYQRVLSQASRPVILHWLGEAFDANLAGYFGAAVWPDAASTVRDIIGENLHVVAGIKMSLLDVEAERTLRRALPEPARLFTGDDFHYVDLIEGATDDDGVHRHSDALLGAFAAFPDRASVALRHLDVGDIAAYRATLGPTEALARQVFAAPTQFYKTGIAFLSWLNGHQASFTMVGGLHTGRSLPHLSSIVELADRAAALADPELAARRWRALLRVNGFDA